MHFLTHLLTFSLFVCLFLAIFFLHLADEHEYNKQKEIKYVWI